MNKTKLFLPLHKTSIHLKIVSFKCSINKLVNSVGRDFFFLLETFFFLSKKIKKYRVIGNFQ